MKPRTSCRAVHVLGYWIIDIFLQIDNATEKYERHPDKQWSGGAISAANAQLDQADHFLVFAGNRVAVVIGPPLATAQMATATLHVHHFASVGQAQTFLRSLV